MEVMRESYGARERGSATTHLGRVIVKDWHKEVDDGCRDAAEHEVLKSRLMRTLHTSSAARDGAEALVCAR